MFLTWRIAVRKHMQPTVDVAINISHCSLYCTKLVETMHEDVMYWKFNYAV